MSNVDTAALSPQYLVEQAIKRSKQKKLRRRIMLYAGLVFVALLYVFPFLWTISTALKTPEEFRSNPTGLFASNPQWINFYKVTQSIPFFRMTLNSLFLAFIVVLATTITSALVGYSFSKLRWPGRNICFMLSLMTMMLPAQILSIPTFLLHLRLGFIDTYMPLILPALMGGSAYNIFLLAAFYGGIPNELSESAKIDGASGLSIWWKIYVPLVFPMVCAVGIFAFLNSWNDFFNPLIYLNTESKFPLVLGLRGFQQQNNTQWDMMMAGSIMSMIPTLVIYFIFQKYFMEGVSISSGVKG